MKIFFVNGVRAGEELDLALPIISIGREEDNAVMLLTGGVSRYHGELRRDENGTWTVVDLQSTNGIKVNRSKIAGKAILSEGDLIEFGDQMLRVTQLASSPPKVVFSPVGAPAANEPAPHLNKSADPTVRLSAPPLPPPAAPAVAPVTAAEAPRDDRTVHDLSEALKSGKVKLFGGRGETKGAAPETGDGKASRRIFSNRLFYTVVVCAVAVAIAAFYHITQLKKQAQTAPAEAKFNPKDFLLFYEKEIISSDNVFRFALQIEHGKALFIIDDLKSQRRFQREIEDLTESNLEILRNSIERSGFMAMRSPESGVAQNNEDQRRRLVIGERDKVNDVTVLNNTAPKAFDDVEYAINAFAENYGLQTIAMTPEELREQAEQSFVKAEDLFANREAKLSNLRSAIQRYTLAVNYLEQFSPKPALWDRARKRLEEAEKIRRQKYQDLDYERIRLINVKEFEQLRFVLHQMMELCDPDSREYDSARQRLFKLDNYLNRTGKKK